MRDFSPKDLDRNNVYETSISTIKSVEFNNKLFLGWAGLSLRNGNVDSTRFKF